jgi:hypothetical protein
MTADAFRRSSRPSHGVAARTALATLAAAAALAAIATIVVACAPPRDTGAPTAAPTLAAVTPPVAAMQRS